MQCPRCGHENPKGTEICEGCHRIRFVRKPKKTDDGKKTAENGKADSALVRGGAEKLRTPSGRVKTPSGGVKTPSGRVKTPSGRVKTPSGKTKAFRGTTSETATTRRPRTAPETVQAESPLATPKASATGSGTTRVPTTGKTWGPPPPQSDSRATVRRDPGELKRALEATPPIKAACRPAPSTAERSPAERSDKHFLVPIGAPPLELKPGTVFTIGRNIDCSLCIPSGRVSRTHAEIKWVDGNPVITDLNSSNGTFVGGKPIKEHSLVPGDELEIGPFHCVYKTGDPKTATPAPVNPGETLSLKTMVTPAELLSGGIGEGRLTEVLQGLEFNTKSGTLMVFSPEGQGWLTVTSGQPQAAEAGPHKDLEAVMFMLALRDGRFTFTEEVVKKERRMKGTMTGILLEWGRRADEGQGTRT